MNETLDFDKAVLPVLKVKKGGKTYEVLPMRLLSRIEEGLAKHGKKNLTTAQATGIIRRAAGIASLTPDEALRLRQAAEELVARTEEAKKKRMDLLGFSAPTPGSGEPPDTGG